MWFQKKLSRVKCKVARAPSNLFSVIAVSISSWGCATVTKNHLLAGNEWRRTITILSSTPWPLHRLAPQLNVLTLDEIQIVPSLVDQSPKKCLGHQEKMLSRGETPCRCRLLVCTCQTSFSGGGGPGKDHSCFPLNLINLLRFRYFHPLDTLDKDGAEGWGGWLRGTGQVPRQGGAGEGGPRAGLGLEQESSG